MKGEVQEDIQGTRWRYANCHIIIYTSATYYGKWDEGHTKMNVRCGSSGGIDNYSNRLIIQWHSIEGRLPNAVWSLHTYHRNKLRTKQNCKLAINSRSKQPSPKFMTEERLLVGNAHLPTTTTLLMPLLWSNEWRWVAKKALKRVFTSL